MRLVLSGKSCCSRNGEVGWRFAGIVAAPVTIEVGGGKGAWGQAAALHSGGRALNAPTALRCSGLRPRRGTRCVRFALCAQTAATSMMTNRASRLAASPVLLAATEARCGLSPRAFADALLVFGIPNTKDTAARQAVAGGGDLWGAEEHSPRVGARSALRCHSGRGCSNAAPAGRIVSSAARPSGEHHRAVGAFSARPPQCEPPPATACRDARNHLPLVERE